MVHAEASTFAAGLNKEEVYAQVLEQLTALLDGQRNWVWYATTKPARSPAHGLIQVASHNLSNASSLLYHALLSLPSPSSAVNWCGFYVLDPLDSSQLILGPFQGHVACQQIAFGKGVCGTAAKEAKTQLVEDVEQFPGHIACDSRSKSEIVVPIVKEGKVVAIIDVDCAELAGFDGEDRRHLERFADILANASDF